MPPRMEGTRIAVKLMEEVGAEPLPSCGSSEEGSAPPVTIADSLLGWECKKESDKEEASAAKACDAC